MNILIVDDEIHSAQLIKRHLVQISTEDEISTAHNGIEAKVILSTRAIDLAFLDIEMPEITGLDLAKFMQLEYSNTFVVFVTAHSNYALDAFKVDAIDYITKPIIKSDLEKVLEKVSKFRINSAPSLVSEPQINCMAFSDLKLITDKEQVLKWPTQKCKELMTYLCYSGESSGISKWKLYDLLWPDKDDSKSELNLRSTASRLNKALANSMIDLKVKSIKNTYVLEGLPIYTDLKRFQWILSQQQPLDSEKLKCEINFLEQCFASEFLEFIDNEWRVDMAAMVSRLRLSATEKIISDSFNLEQYSQAQSLLEHAVATYPYTEKLQLLMLKLIQKQHGEVEASRYQEKIQALYQFELNCEPQWL